MRSRLIVNIVLLSLVAVLTFIAYNSGDKNKEKTTKLTSVDPASITHISIIHKQRTVVLQKDQQQWRMHRPVQIRANDFRIDSVLKILETASHAVYESASLDLANFDLDQPQTTLTLNDTKIDFGIVNPMNKYRYVKVGDKIHLIDDYHFPLISSQIGTLVALTPLSADANITKLVLPGQVLQKNNQGLWQSNKDISADAIVETIQNWKYIQAFGVHNYLKRQSLGKIEVYLQEQDSPILFQVTDTDPWLIIARPELDLEYHYDLDNYDRLLRPGAAKKLPADLAE